MHLSKGIPFFETGASPQARDQNINRCRPLWGRNGLTYSSLPRPSKTLHTQNNSGGIILCSLHNSHVILGDSFSASLHKSYVMRPQPWHKIIRGKLFYLQLELFCLQLTLFAYSLLRPLLDALSHCKKKAQTVSKKTKNCKRNSSNCK